MRRKGERSKQGQTNIVAYRIIVLEYVHVLMRDEKEGRKKQARSNKHRCLPYYCIGVCTCFNER